MRKTIYTLLAASCMLASCSSDENDNPIPPPSLERVAEINLWGSKSTVFNLGNAHVFQGDVYISNEDYDHPDKNYKRQVINLWDNATIPYEINETNVDEKLVLFIQEAISKIEIKTNIKFVKRTDQVDYMAVIYFNNLTINAASGIGKVGGKQKVMFGNSEYLTKTQVLQTLCHTIGLYGELNHPDRDKFLKVNLDELKNETEYIKNEKTVQYTIFNNRKAYPFDFDINSVMLQPSEEIGCDKKYLMTKLDGTPVVATGELSAQDIKAINTLYPR